MSPAFNLLTDIKPDDFRIKPHFRSILSINLKDPAYYAKQQVPFIAEETSEKFNYRKLTIQTDTESDALTDMRVGEEDIASPEIPENP